ncbi:MAG: response regulator transcription factor [Proteobacteria bacterium]|nr:response regulator transcription factor [Pseudomonadota bacterium]
MKILIIEDSEFQAKMIHLALKESVNYQLYFALDAFEGYSLLKAVPEIDVIVLDNEMPYVNGEIFIEKLKQTDFYKNIPIIMSTVDDSSADYFLKAGADRCLKKPYPIEELTAAIFDLVAPKE